MRKQIHGGDVYRHPGVLDFSSNMNPLGTPDAVLKAAREGVGKIENYPDVRQSRLKAALSVYEQIPQEKLICGNGAAELIFMLAQALRPARAVVLAPTFAEYELALQSVGCRVEHVRLEASQGFALVNADSLCTVIDDTVDLVCLCNPNNPTGNLIEREMILETLEHCKACGTWMLLDECFNDFIEEPQQYTLKSYLKTYPNLFLLKAFTKRYSMAGIRLGYGMCWEEKLLERMRGCVQPWNLSIPAQEAGIAALEEEAYVEQAREVVAAERRWMKEELKKLGFTVYDSRANYIFFRGPEHLAEHCLKQQILIRDCSNYEGLENGYYRVAVKLHEENLRLLEALRITRT